jgi:hypothetical protein
MKSFRIVLALAVLIVAQLRGCRRNAASKEIIKQNSTNEHTNISKTISFHSFATNKMFVIYAYFEKGKTFILCKFLSFNNKTSVK